MQVFTAEMQRWKREWNIVVFGSLPCSLACIWEWFNVEVGDISLTEFCPQVVAVMRLLSFILITMWVHVWMGTEVRGKIEIIPTEQKWSARSVLRGEKPAMWESKRFWVADLKCGWVHPVALIHSSPAGPQGRHCNNKPTARHKPTASGPVPTF